MNYFYKIFFLTLSLPLFSLNLTLKNELYTIQKTVLFQELIVEEVGPSLAALEITRFNGTPVIVSNFSIMQALNRAGVTDVNLSGKECTVYYGNLTELPDNSSDTTTASVHPKTVLEEFIRENIRLKSYELKIELDDQKLPFDMNDLSGEFHWEIPRLENGLKDLLALRKADFIYNDKKYTVFFELTLYTDAYFTKTSYFKDDKLKSGDLILQRINLNAYREPETVVLDLDDLPDTRLARKMDTGEILRFSHLKKIPSVMKDQPVKAVIRRNQLEVTLPCTVLSDGFIHEKVRIRLESGRIRVGVLKKHQGEYYVEI